jgi:hypothetical protein
VSATKHVVAELGKICLVCQNMEGPIRSVELWLWFGAGQSTEGRQLFASNVPVVSQQQSMSILLDQAH